MLGQQRRWAVAAHVILACPLMMAAGGGWAAAPAVGFSDPELAIRAHGLAIGESLRVEGVMLEADGPPEAFELERIRVFSPDARVVVHSAGDSETLPPPSNVYLRGSVPERPQARVLLTVLDGGEIRGLVADAGRYWLAYQPPGASRPQLREISDHAALAAGARRFECGAEKLVARENTVAAVEEPRSWYEQGQMMPQNASRTLRVAVETDYEYYQLFGSIASAVSYAADLFAYASTYFTSEVGADFWLHHVSLWTTSSDPWTQSTSGCCLFEFSRNWNTNMGGVMRSIAHFLSGKTAGGGMSWPGAMCAGAFAYDISGWGCSLSPTVDLYGGDYGFSGDLTGSFTLSNPSVVWDIYAVSHEVGHHFNTPHTHCYSPPVDQCYGSEPGCYSGATSLPCPTPGSGCGTIMSYCHTLIPGMSNISLTFGLNHPWGNNPARVPALMSSYLSTMAASYPLCLDPIIFADFFEAGDASGWSSTVP